MQADMEILETLLEGVRLACAAFPDKRRGDATYSMADIGLSAFSLFFMQSESFLVPPACVGGRAEDVELPRPVWHDGRAHRQPHPRHARPGASLACCSPPSTKPWTCCAGTVGCVLLNGSAIVC